MKKIVSFVLTVLLLLAFAAFAMGSGSSESSGVNVESNKSNDSAQETQKAEETENKRTEVHVGETLDVNGLKITYDSAEYWTSNNEFFEPDEGKQFIRLHLTVNNETKSDKYVSEGEFDCYVDGEKCDNYIYGDDTLSYESISTGRKATGYIYFEIPVGAKEIEVEYETSFWTDEKAYFIVELA